MNKLTIVVHRNYLINVIKKIHELGMMEIIDIEKEKSNQIKDFEKGTIHPETSLCMNYEIRLSRVIDILKKYTKKNKGLKNIINPTIIEKRQISDDSIDEIYSQIEYSLNEIEKNIIKHEENIEKNEEKTEELKNEINSLNYFKDFNINLSDIGKSKYLIIKIGKTYHYDKLKNEIEKLEKTIFFSKQFGKGKNKEWSIVIASHISEYEKLEKICRDNLNEIIVEGFDKKPNEAITKLENELKELKKDKSDLINNLKNFSKDQLSNLLVLYEQIKIERIRKEISSNFLKSNSTYIIKGWILEENKSKLKDEILNISKDRAICSFNEPSFNPDMPPTHLKTPKWARSFKTILELFSIPKYNEIDPSIIMGIFFILFFGIMLGDAGYGLVILILSMFFYFKFLRFQTILKDFCFMGIWIGLVTTIVGFLTNSIFGDFLQRFIFHDMSKTLLNFEFIGIQFPVESVRNPLDILIIALIFGLIHLNVGIMLAIYQSFKNKKIKELFTKHFTWIILQIGGAGLIGELLLHIWELSLIQFYISAFFVIIGLILLLIDSGPLGLFDITGYIGDWLSYARLLALGLGTTGMALAFNVVAEIIPNMIPFIGIVFVPIILIITHTANLGIQSLGAAVHSLRLQYVEFFNRFYEGGGKEFKPFSINRKYTKIVDYEYEK